MKLTRRTLYTLELTEEEKDKLMDFVQAFPQSDTHELYRFSEEVYHVLEHPQED